MARRGDRVLFLAVLLGILALVLGLRLWSSPRDKQPAAAPAAPAPLLQPDPVTLAPGIHLLGGLSPAVAYVVETPDGLVLVDSGLQAEAEALLVQMGRLRLAPDRLRAILLTHVHADHSLGAEHLRT